MGGTSKVKLTNTVRMAIVDNMTMIVMCIIMYQRFNLTTLVFLSIEAILIKANSSMAQSIAIKIVMMANKP